MTAPDEFALPPDDERDRLEQLVEQVRSYERAWARARDQEFELLRAETLPDLLGRLTAGLAAAYRLDAVALLLEDPQHQLRHLLHAEGVLARESPAVRYVDSLLSLAPQFVALRRPWLGAYSAADHGLIFSQPSIRSIALLPLRVGARTVGVICFGSVDPARFDRSYRTDVLQHLAGIAGVCFENACNRARVLRSGLSDYLTGWHNRRYLALRLREEFARAQRECGSVACLMLDVDHFKSINDTFGHQGGDAVLREITARIDGIIRKSDIAVRFGGDEFTLLLPATGRADAGRLAERIQAAFCDPIDIDDAVSKVVTLSIGVAAIEHLKRGDDCSRLPDLLLTRADAALYEAKARGRNRIEMASTD
jgi:diguanylate cyclase (GGDEF)-like protein